MSSTGGTVPGHGPSTRSRPFTAGIGMMGEYNTTGTPALTSRQNSDLLKQFTDAYMTVESPFKDLEFGV